MDVPATTSVLIVDDNPSSCHAMARLLEVMGFESSCVLSGPAALSRMQSAVPDLVILDVMMPDMNGLEVLSRLRADARTAAVPVAMFTAVADEQTRAEAIRRGANDYWVKASFDFNVMKERIESLLAGA